MENDRANDESLEKVENNGQLEQGMASILDEKRNNITFFDTLKKFAKKNKFYIMIGGIIGVICIFFIVIINLIISFIKGKPIEYPLVYLTSKGELKFILSNKKEGISIANSYTDSIQLKYSNNSNRYILYTKGNNLYLVDTNKKNSSEKIVSDVGEFDFSLNDKYIIFTDENDNLYSYINKNKTKLDTKITSINAISNDNVFYKKDGNLYVKNFTKSDSSKIKIAVDYKDAYFNKEYTEVLFSKKNDNDLYDYYIYYVKNNKSVRVLEDVFKLDGFSDDFTKFIYSVENSGETFDLSKIVEDDKKEEDKNFKLYSYQDYINGEVDYSVYRESLSEKSNVEDRNKIREQLSKGYTLPSTYDVYYKSGNKKIEIVTGVDKVMYADADTGRVIYSKISYDTNNKIKLSEVNYFYKIKNHLSECANNNVMYKYLNKDASELVLGIKDNMKIYIIENDLYYILDDNLYYSRISGSKLGKVISLAENVKIIESTGVYKKSLLFATDVKRSIGDLRIAKSGKVFVVSDDVYMNGIDITDSNKIVYYTNYQNNSGDYMIYDGKEKLLFNDISRVIYVNDKYMYVFKDYDELPDTFDLYRYNGSKLNLIDYGVEVAY